MVTCSVAVVVVAHERVTEVNEGSVVVVDDSLDSGPVSIHIDHVNSMMRQFRHRVSNYDDDDDSTVAVGADGYEWRYCRTSPNKTTTVTAHGDMSPSVVDVAVVVADHALSPRDCPTAKVVVVRDDGGPTW
jgi:hypothetical protein